MGPTGLQEKKAADLLDEVRRLGRYPIEFRAPEGPGQEQERVLAKKLRMARAAALFRPAEEAELVAIQTEDKEGRCRQKALDVMEAVRAFGKMPRRLSQTQHAKKEHQLRRQLDSVLKQGGLNSSELAELEEYRWMRRREDEWKVIARAKRRQ